MRKILSILAAIGLTSTAASAVVACGNKTSSEVTKTNIKMLFNGIKLVIDGTVEMTADDAFTAFQTIGGVKEVLTTNKLNQADFTLVLNKPSYTSPGTLTITVKTLDLKYTGSITVDINAIGQTNISELVKNTVIEDAVGEVEGLPDGNPAMTADEAFQAFLVANSDIEGLKNMVEYDASFYKPASFANGDGYLIVNAKSDSAYSGNLHITVKFVVDATNLKEILRALSFEGLYNFRVPVNTQQMDLISNLNNEVKQIYLGKYGSFGTNIVDINTIGVREGEIPTQEQLDTVGTVWKPSRFVNTDGISYSNLRLTVKIDYEDGTSTNVTVYDVECSITVITAA